MRYKNIDYFLDAEKKYNETPVPDMIYIEGDGFGSPYEPLHFLRRKPFESLSPKAIKSNGANGLSDVEWLMLYCFMGHFSCYFRSDYYRNDIPEIVVEMQRVLDSVVKKAPKSTAKILYRFLNSSDKCSFQIGEIYEPTHSLTTTTREWHQDKDKYVITPLEYDKTKAHSLYELYNPANENQVNYERGAQFRVMDIKQCNKRNVIYLSEIG